MSQFTKYWQHTGEDYGFQVRIPSEFVQTINPDETANPLAKQFLPNASEKDAAGSIDPLKEHGIIQDGIIQKYKHRVLITVTGSCAIHCRYCFRRHFPYQQHTILKHLDKLSIFLNKNADINEVILSGGDPLMLKNHQLNKILDVIKQADSIKIIRLHTRIPAVLPSRIDPEFLNLIAQNPQWKWVIVTHINHADELSQLNQKALNSLRSYNVTLLNQSVLLKSVNDCASTLRDLSLKLFEFGILPYYIHQLDPVQGAMHFEVDIQVGKRIIKELQTQLPGYLVPKYVQEQPGKPNKVIL